MPLTGRLTAGDRRGRPACHGTWVKAQRSRLAIFSWHSGGKVHFRFCRNLIFTKS
jgi:hypothetical protein